MYTKGKRTYYEAKDAFNNKSFVIVSAEKRVILGKFKFEGDAQLDIAAPKLYEALKALLKRYVGLVNSGDAGFWDAEKEDVVINARKALVEVK